MRASARPLSIVAFGLALVSSACATTSNRISDGGRDAGPLVECDPTANPDTCATGGQACTPDYTQTSSTGYYCELPGAFFNCIPEAGCATSNLQCVGADAGVSGECLATCATTADCNDPLTACGPVEDGGPTFCLINLCVDFWQPCPGESVDGGDGTCVFFYVDPTYGPLGACLQAGSVPLNGACSYYRGAGNLLCANGLACMVSGGEAQTGDCMALCDAVADGGPACAGTCIYSIPPGPPPPISALDVGTQAGGCASACNADAQCSAPYSCYELSAIDQALCLP